MKQTPHAKHGFTLIELLTVIAIIGILAALLFPAIKSSLLKAEAAKAQTEIHTIETALKTYFNEYGKWPNQNGSPDLSYGAFPSGPYAAAAGYCENYWLMNTLRALTDSTADPATGCGNGNNLANPKKISFIEISAKSLDANGNYLDPWKSPYQITLDTDYDNTCTNLANTLVNSIGTPGGVKSVPNRTAVVWSLGPDGLGGTKDDVITW